MNSHNSTYYDRIADEDNGGITSDKAKRVSVWKECLIQRANLSSALIQAIESQAEADNHAKPIGLFFDDMEWVEEQDPDFKEREVTKQSSLCESFYNFARGFPIEASAKNASFSRDPVPRAEVAITLTYVLDASELDEPAEMKEEDMNLWEYVTSKIEQFESHLDVPV
jgi:hypothetical protein